MIEWMPSLISSVIPIAGLILFYYRTMEPRIDNKVASVKVDLIKSIEKVESDLKTITSDVQSLGRQISNVDGQLKGLQSVYHPSSDAFWKGFWEYLERTNEPDENHQK